MVLCPTAQINITLVKIVMCVSFITGCGKINVTACDTSVRSCRKINIIVCVTLVLVCVTLVRSRRKINIIVCVRPHGAYESNTCLARFRSILEQFYDPNRNYFGAFSGDKQVSEKCGIIESRTDKIHHCVKVTPNTGSHLITWERDRRVAEKCGIVELCTDKYIKEWKLTPRNHPGVGRGG